MGTRSSEWHSHETRGITLCRLIAMNSENTLVILRMACFFVKLYFHTEVGADEGPISMRIITHGR